MKKKPSFRNMFDILLAVFFTSWMFFEIIILGNKFDVFKYNSPSGRFVAIIGELSPVVAVYMFMTVWKDVKDAGEFIKKIFDCKSHARTVLCLFAFMAVHYVGIRLCGIRTGYKPLFLIVAIPLALLNYGLAEVAWRGIIFTALWEHLPFVLSCVMAGFMNTCYFLPLWTIDGASKGLGDFSVFMLYSVYTAILLGCIYRITGSVAACVVFQSYIHILMYYYDELILGNSRAVIVYMVEMLAAVIAAYVFGVGVPGRGWSAPEGDEFI